MVVFLILAILGLLSGLARAITYDFYGDYVILKNKHFSIHYDTLIKPRIHNTRKLMSFKVKISYARYNIGMPEQMQINKLMGYSSNLFTHHHKGSFRLGWNYVVDTDQINLYSYTYDTRGFRRADLLVRLPVNSDGSVSFNVKFKTIGTGVHKKHIIYIDDQKYVLDASIFFEESKYGWVLFPYFGGQVASPDSFVIKISAPEI